MSDQQTPGQMVARQSQSNGLGIAGFIVSLVGWLTCGLLCPVGLILSVIGLFKQPRGMAIAGSVIGGFGSLFLVFFGFALTVGLLGLKSVDVEKKQMRREMDQMRERFEAEFEIEPPVIKFKNSPSE